MQIPSVYDEPQKNPNTDQINILFCLKYPHCHRETLARLKKYGSNVINIPMTNHWSYTCPETQGGLEYHHNRNDQHYLLTSSFKDTTKFLRL